MIMRSVPVEIVQIERLAKRSAILFMYLLLGPALFVLCPVVSADTAEISDEVLVDRLRGGGFNLYFRHVATDWSQSDDLQSAGDWRSCDPARMRQLSNSGRAEAQAIGKAMRELKIPVGEVLASPYCRTVETARLMGLGEVKFTTDVMNLRAEHYFGGRDAIVATARRLLATPPAAGANRVIVAHGNVAREATPVYPGEGEGIVFVPDGNGGFQVLDRVSPERWTRLLAGFAE